MAERSVVVRLRAVTGQYESALQRAGVQTAAFGRGVQGLTGFAEQHARAFTIAGVAAMAGGALIVRSLKQSTDAAMELNAGMAEVATLIPNATGRVVELRGEVQRTAVDTAKSTEDITGGLYQVVSAFGDTADTAGILDINARAAAAGLAETTEAIDLTSAVTKGYGDTSAEAVQHASDLAFTAVRLGQTTFPELAGSIGRVTPLAAALNVTQEELFGTMATFTGVTGNAAEVSTQLTSVLTAMMNPSEELAGLMQELGFASGEAMIESLGLQGTIDAIGEAADRTGTPIMAYLRRKEAVTLALAATGGQSDVFSEKLDEMSDVAGATDTAFGEMSEGINAAGFRMEQARIQIEVARQQIGETFVPTVGAAYTVVGNLAQGFAELPGPMQQAAGGATAVAGGLGLIGGAALIALPRVAATQAAVASLGVSSTITGTALHGLVAILRNPYVMAIGAAAAAIMAYIKAKGEAIAMGDRFEASLQDASGSLDNTTRAWVEAELAQRGALDTLTNLGLSVDDVAQAIAGVPEAQERVNEAFDAGIPTLNRWRDAFVPGSTLLRGLRSDTGDLAIALEALNDQFPGVIQRMREAGDPTIRLMDALGQTAETAGNAEYAAPLLTPTIGDVEAALAAVEDDDGTADVAVLTPKPRRNGGCLPAELELAA